MRRVEERIKMLMQAVIKITYPDKIFAKSVFNAVNPDNLTAPPPLKVKSYLENNTLINEIVLENNKFERFLSTIDDLLISIILAENVTKKMINPKDESKATET
ncbi:MAG: KEOPS complex subunit Pcc1 [Candidatus Wukongarchaeota archaeon]|nr:KEOPS complex subunit Pcc1 [Candidatus Wukongarchaeota archaeon]